MIVQPLIPNDPGRQRAARPVTPAISVRVWPARIWPPTLGLIGTPLWQRAAGIRLSDPVSGWLTELVVTQAGDILGRIQFPITVDRDQRTEVMLLPISDMWELRADSDRHRLLHLVRAFGVRS